MSMLIIGHSKCPICKKTIKDDEKVIMFPSFVQNMNDPFYVFNDSVVHEKCLLNHNLKEKALHYLELIIQKNRPENRICDIGGNTIYTPENYLFIDLLTSNDKEPLSNYNFTTIDIDNISKWKYKDVFLKNAKKYLQDKKWKSLTNFNYLEYLIKEIDKNK